MQTTGVLPMQWFFELHATAQAFLASLFMYFMTALGAACVFFSKRIGENVLSLLTGGAAGIMIAASFFSLLLPALDGGVLSVTFGFLLGGVFIVCSDLALSHTQMRFDRLGDKKSALLYFAVMLHNVPEGMAVGVAFACAGTEGAILSAILLAIGIAIQNFPEGMCVVFPLRAKGMTRMRSFLFAQGSGAVEIPACILGALMASMITPIMPWALSFSAGAMIAVVCSELIPECFSKNKTLASAGVVLGFCLMMLLDVALG